MMNLDMGICGFVPAFAGSEERSLLKKGKPPVDAADTVCSLHKLVVVFSVGPPSLH